MTESTRLDSTMVTDFYARQNVAIDEGDAQAWAATYTADGSFASPTYGGQVVGRENLIEFALRARDQLAAEGIQQRHWVNNVVIDASSSSARAYMMILRTDSAGSASLLRLITVEDRFQINADGTLSMRSRKVSWEHSPS